MKRIILTFIAAALFQNAAIAGPAEPARASAPIVLAGEIKVRKQVVENGVERVVFVEPQVVVPGDCCQHRRSASNQCQL